MVQVIWASSPSTKGTARTLCTNRGGTAGPRECGETRERLRDGGKETERQRHRKKNRDRDGDRGTERERQEQINRDGYRERNRQGDGDRDGDRDTERHHEGPGPHPQTCQIFTTIPAAMPSMCP